MREMVAFTGPMLDARYWMLDIDEYPQDEIQNHPVSRNQDPGSINTCNGFHRNGQV